jgi:hypothetical protein
MCMMEQPDVQMVIIDYLNDHISALTATLRGRPSSNKQTMIRIRIRILVIELYALPALTVGRSDGFDGWAVLTLSAVEHFRRQNSFDGRTVSTGEQFRRENSFDGRTVSTVERF